MFAGGEDGEVVSFFKPIVTLTKEEMANCERVALERMKASERLGYKNQYGASRTPAVDNLGCYGEYAVCKQRGEEWREQVCDGKNPDVITFEIKTASKLNYNLILRERDRDLPGKRVIIFVTRDESRTNEFIIQGWITRAEASLYARQDALDPTREPAWKVLQKYLRDYGNLF